MCTTNARRAAVRHQEGRHHLPNREGGNAQAVGTWLATPQTVCGLHGLKLCPCHVQAVQICGSKHDLAIFNKKAHASATQPCVRGQGGLW